MKNQFFLLILILVVACQPQSKEKDATEQNPDNQVKTDVSVAVTSADFNAPFTLSAQAIAVELASDFPFLHSCAWARQGSKLLLIGGRKGGFHGLSSTDDPFSTKKAGASISVVDLVDYSHYSMPLGDAYPDLIQFKGSNFLSYQDQDTLFIGGGYGPLGPDASESNTTYSGIYAIQVSSMINEVINNGNPRNAILKYATSPVVQVSGGELLRQDGYFYACFGQNYEGEYELQIQGKYTNAIRRFRWDGPNITDTLSAVGAHLHRRDLNVMPILGTPGVMVGYAGVFNSQDNGFPHPVYFRPSFTSNEIKTEWDTTFSQKTNQYKSAVANIYSPSTKTNTHAILGGIGRYQWDPNTQSWEDGDNGALLPFVKTITQMTWQDGVLTQNIQLPPAQPALPELLGSNAVFLPKSEFLYEQNVVNYDLLPSGTTSIGWLYGGIKSPKPTSSGVYPTTINKTIYEILLSKP